jgi:hypothetical protein
MAPRRNTMAEWDSVVKARIEAVRGLGERICESLSLEVRNLGLSSETHPIAAFDDASFELSEDPYSRDETLTGTWRNGRDAKVGSVVFHGDGSFYAEYDLVCAHPRDARWFVEAVTAWGRGEQVKTEARLLPALS